MVSIRPLTTKYFKKITDYSPRKIVGRKKSKYIQTADNCWIYCCLNDLYFITGIDLDGKDVEKFIQSYGFNTKLGWLSTDSWVLICEYVKQKLNKDIMMYEFGATTSPALLWKMRVNWYALIYSRDNGTAFKQDVLKDDEVDTAFNRTPSQQHNTCAYFYNLKLYELWTRWDADPMNEFTFHSPDIFIQSIRNWGIRNQMRFLDFKK